MSASPEHWHTRARRSAAAIRGGILGRRSGGVAAAEAPRLKNANFAVHNKVYARNYFGLPQHLVPPPKDFISDEKTRIRRTSRDKREKNLSIRDSRWVNRVCKSLAAALASGCITPHASRNNSFSIRCCMLLLRAISGLMKFGSSS